MDDEEVDGDGGGADGRGDGVDDGGVEGAGTEEEEELGGEGAGKQESRGSEEDGEAKGNGEESAPRGDEIEGAVVAAEPDLGEPAAGDGGEEAVDGGDFTSGKAGSGDGVAGEAAEEGGKPGGNAADGESPHRHAESGGEEGGVAEEAGEAGAFRGRLEGVGGATLRFADEEPEGEGDEDSRSGGHVEGHAPAVAVAEDAAQKIAEGSADRDGDVENA